MKHIPFMPTIFEHAAFLIGQTPSAAACSAALMEEAHIEAHRRYHAGAVTVGIDVYNIEAEALGCKVQFYNDCSIPGIVSHALTLDDDPGAIAFSTSLGRIQTVLDAATGVRHRVDGDVPVSVGVCGPYSILIELLGFETAMEAFYDGEEKIALFLEALLNFQKDYCNEIIARGLGITVFESWASPPLVSPDIYREFVAPYEKKLFAYLRGLGIKSRPLVIGGDTRAICDNILDTGTSLLLSDYNTPLAEYAKMAQTQDVFVRANIDPKMVQKGNWCEISKRVCEIHTYANLYPKLIAGTGVIPYDTPPENLLRVKQMLNDNQ